MTNTNNIKANKETAVQNIMKAGTVFTALLLIICIVEEIILTISFIKCNSAYPCYKEGEEYEIVSTQVYVGFFFFKQNHTKYGNYSQISNFDNFNQIKRRISSNEIDENNYVSFCYNTFLTSYVYAVAYVTFSVIEIMCIVGCCFWASAKNIYTSEEIITQNYSSQKNSNQTNQNKNNNQNNNRPQININNPQIIFVNQGNNNQLTNQQNSYNQNNEKNNKNINNNKDPKIPPQQINIPNNNESVNYPSQILIKNNSSNKNNNNNNNYESLNQKLHKKKIIKLKLIFQGKMKKI